MLSAISKAIVAILREHYGRGPMKAKTYVIDDLIIVVMRGSGFTPLEQTIMDDDGAERVIAMRHHFQRVMADRYKQTINELTGRNVLAFSPKPTSNPTSRSRCSSWTDRWRASAPSRPPSLDSPADRSTG